MIFLWAKCFLRCKLKITICNSIGNCKLLFFWWKVIFHPVVLQQQYKYKKAPTLNTSAIWWFVFPLGWQKLATFQTGQSELSHRSSSKDLSWTTLLLLQFYLLSQSRQLAILLVAVDWFSDSKFSFILLYYKQCQL